MVVQSCTAATAAKDCLELTRHAQAAGVDIVYLQTPTMETHGDEGVLGVRHHRLSGRVAA